MQIIQKTTDFEIEGRSAVTIGKFDGIHLGHQALLRYIAEQRSRGLKAVVFTFDPPPAAFFGLSGGKELMTGEEKRTAFERLGVDVLIEFPLTAETAAIAPRDFIEGILRDRLHTAYLAAGADISFGAGGRGSCRLLEALQEPCGYRVQIIDKVRYQGQVISSTAVRAQVEKGGMESAAGMLGRPFSLSGPVVCGNRLGRTMGMPTANLLPPKNKLLPPAGVYFSEVCIGNCHYRGITNIGCKPTVSDSRQPGAETYIYDFDSEIYGREIQVSLLKFKRPERKFSGMEELRRQMRKDVEEGRAFRKFP
ncbi:MAG: riboflavin biosynthesis protein RibF [Kineothrix sp.]